MQIPSELGQSQAGAKFQGSGAQEWQMEVTLELWMGNASIQE